MLNISNTYRGMWWVIQLDEHIKTAQLCLWQRSLFADCWDKVQLHCDQYRIKVAVGFRLHNVKFTKHWCTSCVGFSIKCICRVTSDWPVFSTSYNTYRFLHGEITQLSSYLSPRNNTVRNFQTGIRFSDGQAYSFGFCQAVSYAEENSFFFLSCCQDIWVFLIGNYLPTIINATIYLL